MGATIVRASTFAVLGASVVLLAGCTLHPAATRSTVSGSPSIGAETGSAPGGTSSSPAVESVAPAPVGTPTPASGSGNNPSAVPAPTAASSTTNAARARELARRACGYVANGFAASAVSEAAPVAARAATLDDTWRVLASNLDFMNQHPVDPQTGAGPARSGEMAAGVAKTCSSSAGVPVSRD